jgi:O-ureido-D-serine cyclo-ligase
MPVKADSLRIALVSARAAHDLDEDLSPLVAALRVVRADVHVVDWDDATIEWSAFNLALLRSTWDYAMRLAEFLAWAERVEKQTRLVNPLPVIRWNTDKHYLADLARAGVSTVASEFVEPGQDASAALAAFRSRHDCDEMVVKPAVGAGSRDAQRHRCSELSAIEAHIRRLTETGRSALLQPYLDRVDSHGETALIYFAGEFSHAIRKGALLRSGESPTAELFAAEAITPRTPAPEELSLGRRVLAAIPFGTLLYARVDLIRDAEDSPCVLELELTEPSVFLLHSQGAAERFAAAILAWRPD